MKQTKEKEFDKLADEYFDKFNRNYPIMITDDFTFDEAIKEIKEALKSGKPIERILEDDVDY
jgi:hypothetical protein